MLHMFSASEPKPAIMQILSFNVEWKKSSVKLLLIHSYHT